MKSKDLRRMAVEKLRGAYLKTVLGQIICYIPTYIAVILVGFLALISYSYVVGEFPQLSDIEKLLSLEYTVESASVIFASLYSVIAMAVVSLFSIFVIDILTVGYVASLLDLDREPQEDKKYNINTIFLGFSKHYGSIFKTMFLRRVYVFLWGMIVAICSLPLMIGSVYATCMVIAGTATDDIVNAFAGRYGIWMIVSFILTIASSVLYVVKVYRYEMIPMIVAENPDIKTREAFKKTKEIMVGYRWRYFVVQLYFILLALLVSIITGITGIGILSYIGTLAIAPYMNMTFVQFYLSRTKAEMKENEIPAEVVQEGEDDINEN